MPISQAKLALSATAAAPRGCGGAARRLTGARCGPGRPLSAALGPGSGAASEIPTPLQCRDE